MDVGLYMYYMTLTLHYFYLFLDVLGLCFLEVGKGDPRGLAPGGFPGPGAFLGLSPSGGPFLDLPGAFAQRGGGPWRLPGAPWPENPFWRFPGLLDRAWIRPEQPGNAKGRHSRGAALGPRRYPSRGLHRPQ